MISCLSVAQRCIPIGISEVALRLPLIVVAFYTSRGARPFASGLQIPVGGFGLEYILTRNCFSALLRLTKPYSGSLSPFCRSNRSSMAGEDNRGKRVAEEIPEESMPMNQCLRRMR